MKDESWDNLKDTQTDTEKNHQMISTDDIGPDSQVQIGITTTEMITGPMKQEFMRGIPCENPLHHCHPHQVKEKVGIQDMMYTGEIDSYIIDLNQQHI